MAAKIVKLKQNTPEWLEWRKSGIGGSDANAIMGASPWASASDIWREKVGLGVPIRENTAMARGRANEPKAREKLAEALSGHLGRKIVLQPICLEDLINGVPWKCSYDGVDENMEISVEIKCPVKPYTPLTEVPDKYVPQVQHQMMGIHPKHSYYAEYFAATDQLEVLEIHEDPIYIPLLIASEKQFWDLVMQKQEPETGLTNLNKNNDFVHLARSYRDAKFQLLAATERYKHAEDKLKTLSETHHIEKAIVNGVLISKVVKKGNIDYKAPEIVKALSNIDLEEYRKKGSEYFAIRLRGMKDGS